MNRQAVAYAQQRAAELVTDIEDSTRDELRGIIARGIDAGATRDDILEEIEGSRLFSEDRAALIADTEIRMANGQGRLEGYRAARDAGVKLKKVWVTDGDPCPSCQENEDAGPIDLDESFPSGDDIDPAHPNCYCSTTTEIEEEDDGEGNDSE